MHAWNCSEIISALLGLSLNCYAAYHLQSPESIPHSVAILGSFAGTSYLMVLRGALVFSNTPLPARPLQIFTTVNDQQTELCILVLEGHSPVASQNRVLGQFDLTGMPPAPKHGARIEVTFVVDEDNMLSVSARVSGPCNLAVALARGTHRRVYLQKPQAPVCCDQICPAASTPRAQLQRSLYCI